MSTTLRKSGTQCEVTAGCSASHSSSHFPDAGTMSPMMEAGAKSGSTGSLPAANLASNWMSASRRFQYLRLELKK